MLVEAALKFASKDIREAAPRADETGQLPPTLIDKGWELGLLASSIPEAYGGFGARSAVTLALAAEELAYGDLAAAMAILAPNLFALPILIAGSQEQKQAHLPKFCAGGYRPATAALMEPRYDFRPDVLKTTARSDGDGWVLDGEKCYVPMAADAEHLLVYAALDGQTQGFVVRRESPGLSIGEREQNMGIRALPTYTLKLSNCKVPCPDRLGGDSGHDFAPIINASRAARMNMRSSTPRSVKPSASRSHNGNRSRSSSPRWRPRSKRRG